ncbi:MAG: hypothetical protein ACE5KT_08075 [Methanosarcinales archaeon]
MQIVKYRIQEYIKNLKTFLSDEMIKTLTEDASDIYQKLREDPLLSKSHKLVQISIKLACDKNMYVVRDKNLKAGNLRSMTMARKITGISQIIPPTEYVDNILEQLAQYNSAEYPHDIYDLLSTTAKKIIKKSIENGYRYSSPMVIAATAIYVAGIESGYLVTQNALDQCLRVSAVSIRNHYENLMKFYRM